ncbi:MAG: helix-hairpin-helix domain-containing protein [Ruminococcus sp.]|nr:helix-hairpin-helix domain-containing protein [Ruminococcus sp.]
MADNMRKNADNSNKKHRCKVTKTDIALFLFIVVAVSSAIASTALLRKTYHNDNMPENSKSDNMSEMSDKTTKTTDVTKTTKSKTSTVSTTKIKETTKSTTAVKRTTVTSTTAVRFPIDVNYVTFEELLQINGIGETLAQRIINFRSDIGTVYNMDMLLQIDGIGESKLAILKQYLYVANEDYKTTTTSSTAKNISRNTTITTSTTVSSVTSSKVRRKVNINTATAEEISDCLLVDIELAEKIIDLRNQIQYFSNSLELLYIDEFTEKMHAELKDYIVI